VPGKGGNDSSGPPSLAGAPYGRHNLTGHGKQDNEGKVVLSWGWLLLSGAYPLYRLWRATKGSTLRHALAWAWLAWVGWCLAGFFDRPGLHYLALCLTACAGVAVLGARRPTVTTWHLAVGFLLVFLLRPLWERPGDWHLDAVYVTLLGVPLAVGLGNYLPTRLGPTALLLGAWCALDVARLTGVVALDEPAVWLALAAVPWLGLVLARRRGSPAEFDAVWLTFRDRFGFVWAQRLRDQFNRAAANAGLPLWLGWGGLRRRGAIEPDRPLAVLRSALRRFETAGRLDDPPP
jgi:hypothetical protein